MPYSPEALAAKAEITDAFHTYALNVRHKQGALSADLFEPDAVFKVYQADPMEPGSRTLRETIEGREAIIAWGGRSAKTHRLFPALHNVLVTVEGDRAAATALMFNTVYPGPSEMLGEYDDRFVRGLDGRWRWSERHYTIYRAKD